jgi:hypothetical protein
MYLPTFYKISFEGLLHGGKKYGCYRAKEGTPVTYGTFLLPVSFWCKPP